MIEKKNSSVGDQLNEPLKCTMFNIWKKKQDEKKFWRKIKIAGLCSLLCEPMNAIRASLKIAR